MKHLFKALLIIVISALLGLGLMILVYMLPTDPIKENIKRGADILLVQTANYTYAGDYKNTILDNFTDSLILNELCYEVKDPISDSVNVPHYSYPEKPVVLYSTMAYLNGDPVSEADVEIYPRYWHGYATILKPFFLIFDYTDLKILNQAIQLSLLLLVVVLMIKQGLINYLWGFAMMIIFWNPATIGVSIQLSSCFYIAIVSSAVILARPRLLFETNNKKSNLCLFFFLIGILVSYYDFLTYPLVTFAVPFVFYLLMNAERETAANSDKPLLEFIFAGIHWACGYVLMWGSKWLFATLITGNNIFLDASSKIAERSSTSFTFDEGVTRPYVVWFLIRSCIIKWPYIIMFVVTFMAILYLYRNENRHKNKRETNVWLLLTLMILGFLPFLWFFIVANHSYIHNGLVCRILGITIFSWYCLFKELLHVDYAGKNWIGGNSNE